MLAEPIHGLTGDVRRLLAAGSASAATDERLRKRLPQLRALGERVPALAALAGAALRVITAPPAGSAAALLDLLVLLRQVAAALAENGIDGPLEPLPECGPWSTPAPTGELYALHELDPRPVARKRTDRAELLRRASERGTAADLRNLPVFLDVLARPYAPEAAVVLTEVLPFFFGRALLPDLRANRHRGVFFLVALSRYDAETALAEATRFLERGTGLLPLLPRLGPDAVRAFLDELAERPEHAASADSLQRGAALALRRLGRPAVTFLLGLLQGPEQSYRPIALEALGELGPLAGEAVPALLRLLDDPCEPLRRAAIVTLGRIGPPARAAVPALRRLLNQWGQKDLQVLAMEALGGITRRPKEKA
jgi:hypothetical protein